MLPVQWPWASDTPGLHSHEAHVGETFPKKGDHKVHDGGRLGLGRTMKEAKSRVQKGGAIRGLW